MDFRRYILLIEHFQSGKFIEVGDTPSLPEAESVRSYINDFAGSFRKHDEEPVIIVWIKDRETLEVF